MVETGIHIVGARETAGLDRKPERTHIGVPRMSAHALVQEYLNLHDELYGNVEEFGSVYEGLLEYQPVFLNLPVGRDSSRQNVASLNPDNPLNPDSSLEPNRPFPLPRGRLGWGLNRGIDNTSSNSSASTPTLALPLHGGGNISGIEFAFAQGDQRAATGSHYTPDDLVQPLIKHSLDYLIADKLKETDPAKALLDLRVADISCGSGHILLAAARRIATELAIVRKQPSPSAFRSAIRDVRLIRERQTALPSPSIPYSTISEFSRPIKARYSANVSGGRMKSVNRPAPDSRLFICKVAAAEPLAMKRIPLRADIRDAYGWSDLNLDHDFVEVETLPENDRVRYTISPAARKEVLKRLLAENHRRAAAQALAADAAIPAKKKRSKKSASDAANGDLFL